MLWINVAWLDIKKYWKLIFLVLSAIVAFFLLRGQRINFADRLSEINDVHVQEIKKINAIRDKEQRQYKENQRKFEDMIEKIKLQYDVELAELDKKTKKRVDVILDKYKSNPEKLAKELSNVLGFEVELIE